MRKTVSSLSYVWISKNQKHMISEPDSPANPTTRIPLIHTVLCFIESTEKKRKSTFVWKWKQNLWPIFKPAQLSSFLQLCKPEALANLTAKSEQTSQFSQLPAKPVKKCSAHWSFQSNTCKTSQISQILAQSVKECSANLSNTCKTSKGSQILAKPVKKCFANQSNTCKTSQGVFCKPVIMSNKPVIYHDEHQN